MKARSTARKLSQSEFEDFFSQEEWSDVVSVDEKTLARLGWKQVIVTSRPSDEDVLSICAALKKEVYPHTWKDFRCKSVEKAAEELLHFEQAKRPTQLLAYYGVPEVGKKVFFGISAISDRISKDFSGTGFPIISRSCIMPKYRNYRLYAPMVQSRVDLCRKIWGQDLKGIHFGSINPRVYVGITIGHFVEPFVYLGDETYEAGGWHVFRAFILFSEPFKRKLISEAKVKRAGLEMLSRSLQVLIEKLVSNQFDETGFFHFRKIIAQFDEKLSPSPFQKNSAIRQLLEFMEAIPLSALEKISDKKKKPEPHPKIARRK